MKKLIALFTVLTLCLCMTVPAFASDCTNTQTDSSRICSTRATDYGNAWISSSSAGSFTVTTNRSGTIHMTLKAESSSNSSWAYVSVKKPDGTYYGNNIYVDPKSENGAGVHLTMVCSKSGTYTISYNASTTAGMRLMCWIY